MKCPYDNKECDQINTSGMTKLKECSECKRYNYGIRLTGATPILAGIIDYIRLKKNENMRYHK